MPPGRIPKRSDEVLGHHRKVGDVTRVAVGTRKPTWPAAKENWHEDAALWYGSLKKSGQSTYFEHSDIAFAFFIAGQMSDYLNFERRGAQQFSALLTAMSLLLNTEADRRRAGIELVREDPKPVGDSVRDVYQRMLAKKPKASEVGINDAGPTQAAAA